MEVPVSTLPAAERFIVWAARVWIAAHCNDQMPCQRLQNMFQHLQLQDCLGPFYALLSLLVTECSRDLDFRCPGCRSLGEDERKMVTLFAALQQGSTQVAEVVLENWMPAHASQRAAYPARLVAHGMAENGHVLNELAVPRPVATLAVQQALH